MLYYTIGTATSSLQVGMQVESAESLAVVKREGDAVVKEVAEVRAVVDGLESAASATGQSLAEVEQRLDQVLRGVGGLRTAAARTSFAKVSIE